MARTFAFALIFALCLTQTISISTGGGFRGGSSAPRMSSPAPRMSSPSISTHRPSMPAPRPSIPAHRPAVPAPRPSIPAHRPAVPAPRPSIPAPRPSIPAPRPSIPAPRPTPIRPTPTPRPHPTPAPRPNPTHNPAAPKPNGVQTPSGVYQMNPAWKDLPLGNGKTTIGHGGCAISSLAAMADKAGLKINGAAPNTLSMNNWLKANGGFSGSDVKWDTMSKLGLKHTGDVGGGRSAAQALGQGKSALLNVGHHYVLATGSDATGFTVVDPGHQFKNHYTFDQVQSAKIFSR